MTSPQAISHRGTTRDHPMPDDAVVAAAIAGLPAMTPRRLRRLLCGRSAGEIWADLAGSRSRLTLRLLCAGRPARESSRAHDLVRTWRSATAGTDLAEVAGALEEARVTVLRRGDDGYPRRLVPDRSAPEVLFAVGSLAGLEGPTVSVVGTRRASHYGCSVAAELGAGLSAAGVTVVSGLAEGIDAAAHEGSLGASSLAPPVAVVGSGPDVVYPSSSRRLWKRVATEGGLLSEAPLGAPPEPWRFPERNRIIAALSHVVVVVESHQSGGALHTVNAADERGVTVLAVPGSVRSPSSAGTNALLADGCGVARDVDDVLAALSLALPTGVAATRVRARDSLDLVPEPAVSAAAAPGGAELDDDERLVLAALEDTPVTFGVVLARAGRALPAVASALERLADLGLAGRSGAGWERRGG